MKRKQIVAIVLAVDIQQAAAQILQLAHQKGTSVHPACILAVGQNHTLQQQFAIFIRSDPLLLKPIQRRQIPEHSGHPGRLGPGSDQVPAGTLPGDGSDCIDHDGFARTGLTGEHVKAPVKRNVRL